METFSTGSAHPAHSKSLAGNSSREFPKDVCLTESAVFRWFRSEMLGRLSHDFSLLPKAVRAGWFILASLIWTILPRADAQTPSALPGVTNLLVPSGRPGEFVIGGVHLNKEQKVVWFPAQVNMTSGNIEYVVVANTGKTHESLLRTDVQPKDVHLALLLVGATGTTNAIPTDPNERAPGDSVTVNVAWQSNGVTNRLPVERFVYDRKAAKAILEGTWVFTGSRFREEGFAAQLDGSIVSLITDGDALINNSRPGREDDDNWLVQTNGLPPLNTPVEVTIKLQR